MNVRSTKKPKRPKKKVCWPALEGAFSQPSRTSPADLTDKIAEGLLAEKFRTSEIAEILQSGGFSGHSP